MSESNDAASKTEEPTPRKLEQAKQRGEVVKTPDLPSLASLAAAATVVALAGGWMSRNLVSALTPFLAHPDQMSFAGGGGVDIARHAVLAAAPMLLAVILAAVFAEAGFLLIVAGADWFWQRQRFMERMKMTKEELKEDYKQTEGDPHVKARQRQLRNERARRRMMQAVPGATVVVMNPTHYAVALKYDAEETGAPMCVAKGLDTLALKIREIAEEAGVPGI